MPTITVGRERAHSIDIAYEDIGDGPPIVLVHGWPLTSKSWERQVEPLVAAGYRVIAYDRRGFGASSRPQHGYDYHTLADDLRRLLIDLDLQDVTLVGFSMGGGEVARYAGQYGSERLGGIVFVSAVTPFLRKTINNPDGVEPAVFDELAKALAHDRPAFLQSFLADFFNADELTGTRLSEPDVQFAWHEAVTASPLATRALVEAWSGTDFREDLARVDVPALIVHGAADRTVPLAVSAERTHRAIPQSSLVVIEAAPHGLIWTHAAEFNAALLDFLRTRRGLAGAGATAAPR